MVLVQVSERDLDRRGRFRVDMPTRAHVKSSVVSAGPPLVVQLWVDLPDPNNAVAVANPDGSFSVKYETHLSETTRRTYVVDGRGTLELRVRQVREH